MPTSRPQRARLLQGVQWFTHRHLHTRVQVVCGVCDACACVKKVFQAFLDQLFVTVLTSTLGLQLRWTLLVGSSHREPDFIYMLLRISPGLPQLRHAHTSCSSTCGAWGTGSGRTRRLAIACATEAEARRWQPDLPTAEPSLGGSTLNLGS